MVKSETSIFDTAARRREFLALLGLAGMALPFGDEAWAQGLGGGLTGLLGMASDHALDKLAQPGAFYNDQSVRINLPGAGNLGGLGGLGGSSGGGGLGGALGGLLGGGNGGGGLGGALGGVGGLDSITRKLNDAGGQAAHAAKPVFRAAISKMSVSDVPGIIQQKDGGTQYLRKSAGGVLHTQVRPLVDTALANVGAYHALDQLTAGNSMLAQLGLTHDKLGNSVTEQALGGIYKYMGNEEAGLRANPLGALGGAGNAAGGLLGGIKF